MSVRQYYVVHLPEPTHSRAKAHCGPKKLSEWVAKLIERELETEAQRRARLARYNEQRDRESGLVEQALSQEPFWKAKR